MIPIPGVVYNLLTFPLQLFASTMAESALQPDQHSGIPRWQHFAPGQPGPLGRGSLQRDPEPALPYLSFPGIRVFLRPQGVDALGPSDWQHSLVHSGELRARHLNRHPERN